MKRWRGLSRLLPVRAEAGYTITEVMIVLVTTSALFVVVAMTFQGRQARAEFTQAVRSYEAKLQTIITESSSSTYQTTNCRAHSTGITFLQDTPGSCIFLGKVFVPSTTERTTNILSIVGARLTTGASPTDVTSIYDARAIASQQPEVYNHSFQLRVMKMVRASDTTRRVYGIGFMNSLTGAAGAVPASGSILYGVMNTGFTGGSFIDTPSDFIPLPDGVIVCLAGQNGQRAEVTIGGGNSQTQITSELDTPNAGVCSGL